jgi:hypothetical protein
MLVQPATVTRWHREGFRACYRHRSRRRPGRPRIDSNLRALIRRMSRENRLWGAPRIHGELLKLGITVSERTVSRYLPHRARSQACRTFLANHLGAPPFRSAVTSSDAPGDDVVDAGAFPFRSAPSSGDALCISHRWAVVNAPPLLQRTFLGWQTAQAPLQHLTCTGFGSGKDPPQVLDCRDWPPTRATGGFFVRMLHLAQGHEQPKTIRSPNDRSPSAVLGLPVCNHIVNVMREPNAFAPAEKRESATDFHERQKFWRWKPSAYGF